MEISGTITYQDLEGGFWGILASDGGKFVPIEPMPADFRVDGLSIRATLEKAQVLGTAMWGTYVRILDMEKAD